jgi:hypothetical protein
MGGEWIKLCQLPWATFAVWLPDDDGPGFEVHSDDRYALTLEDADDEASPQSAEAPAQGHTIPRRDDRPE